MLRLYKTENDEYIVGEAYMPPAFFIAQRNFIRYINLIKSPRSLR